MTLLEVAGLLGVKEATVQRYESGEIKNLKQHTIARLSEIFNTTPAYLMGWEEETHIKKAPSAEDEGKVTFDDFTYAMNEEAHELTEEEKEKLLELARFFNENRRKGKR